MRLCGNRLEGIFGLVESHLKTIKRDGLLPAGIILTGGGASLSQTVDAAKTTLSLPARTANLEIGKNSKLRDVSWAVAYGLCTWGASDTEETSAIGIVKNSRHNILNWLSQFLP